jgi:hypothetical protein
MEKFFTNKSRLDLKRILELSGVTNTLNESSYKRSTEELVKITLAACERGDLGRIKKNINKLNNQEKLAVLKRAIETSQLNIIDYLFNNVIFNIGQKFLELFRDALGSDKKLTIIKKIIDQFGGAENLDRQTFSFLLVFALRNYSNKRVVTNNDDLKEIIDYLIKKGADINYEDSSSEYTPLITAVFRYNLDIIKYIVNKGASVNYKNSKGKKAADYAADYARENEIKEYLELGYKRDKLKIILGDETSNEEEEEIRERNKEISDLKNKIKEIEIRGKIGKERYSTDLLNFNRLVSNILEQIYDIETDVLERKKENDVLPPTHILVVDGEIFYNFIKIKGKDIYIDANNRIFNKNEEDIKVYSKKELDNDGWIQYKSK